MRLMACPSSPKIPVCGAETELPRQSRQRRTTEMVRCPSPSRLTAGYGTTNSSTPQQGSGRIPQTTVASYQMTLGTIPMRRRKRKRKHQAPISAHSSPTRTLPARIYRITQIRTMRVWTRASKGGYTNIPKALLPPAYGRIS